MLEANEERRDGVTFLEIGGRIDLTAARALDDRLNALIRAGDTQLVLDLARLTYISSLGLRAILMAAKSTYAAKGKLLLCCLGSDIRRLFDVAFANVFEIYASREAALAALRQPARETGPEG